MLNYLKSYEAPLMPLDEILVSLLRLLRPTSFGFYGRSFTLLDTSYGTLGCSFSGGGDIGVYTDTSGYLAYYKIANILEKDSSITPVHDKDTAVLYF
ncbi:uncharacterized protein N7484_010250 [Penicillium longicatenatum]|uniref:uncharacterized protein n=1 Tax=Penicillium longicatenatum TaxID=1561947 RepID=UPI00254772A1|nr:uncharacterized protein N7484_010250 [Penicillium longicatenatum]KAJ5636937.1 hypothetical protein N7484_010250 [Penicillium longicatenatum]